MTTPQPSNRVLLNRRNVLIMIGIVMLFSGVYWLTYSGQWISTDEMFLFDGVESLVRHGNVHLTYMLDKRLIRTYAIGDQPDTLLVNAEPFQMMLAAPLFWLAERLPGIGMVHAVWLLNVLVCAMTGAVLFLFARAQGYSAAVGLVGALIFGFGTIVWPYSKVFFREPLAMFLLFAAALCVYRWRTTMAGWSRWAWLVAAFVFYLLGLLTKEAALLSAPIFVALAFPSLQMKVNWRHLLRRAGLMLLGVLVILLILNVVLDSVATMRSYSPLARLAAISGKFEFMVYALVSYLFSPGRSAFAFSPVLILSVPGVWLLTRDRRWREAILPVLTLGLFVVGYAVLRHEHWFAGISWGARYLVPVTPFVMLAVLPVIERVWHGNWSRRGRWLVGVLVVASVWAQLNGVVISQPSYFEELERRQVIAWEEGVWQLQHTPLLVNPGLLFSEPVDFAWLRVDGAWIIPLMAIGMVVLACVMLYRVMRREIVTRRQVWGAALAAPVLLSVMFLVGLRSLDGDPVFMGKFDKLHDLMDQLYPQLQPDDIIVLTNPEYRLYMANHYRADNLLYVLPLSPGEQPSPDQPPRITSSNPDLLIEPRHTLFLDSLAVYTDRVWLINNSGPFTGFTVRPVEWYMTRHYFPLQSLQTDETTRALLYAVGQAAPSDPAMRWPETITDASFGDEVRLVGFDGPDSDAIYAPGQAVSLSLLWQAERAPTLDYNIGVFVLDAGGRVVAQRDSAPQGGFRSMNLWEAGAYVRDNHGLQLPAALPAGEYAIWVKVYNWQNQESLPVTGQQAVEDGTAAFLQTITVATP
jgi:hypothetical protein